MFEKYEAEVLLTDLYNHGHNIFALFDVLPNFSPQVKQSVIFSNKNGIYQLPNVLRLRILGN